MCCKGTCRKKKFVKKETNERPATSICQSLSGPLSGPEQTVPRAELEAIVQVVENGRLPLTIYTDHRNHMIDFGKGKRYCCRPKGRHVDIWKRIWTRLKELEANAYGSGKT